jgi:hypothetical protein
MYPAIFTLEVGGVPTLTFGAKNLRESWQLCREDWLRKDIARQRSNGVPLWDGKVELRTRYATGPEKSVYLEASGELVPDELLLAYLVKLDADTV